jgi:hypothetical protein
LFPANIAFDFHTRAFDRSVSSVGEERFYENNPRLHISCLGGAYIRRVGSTRLRPGGQTRLVKEDKRRILIRRSCRPTSPIERFASPNAQPWKPLARFDEILFGNRGPHP